MLSILLAAMILGNAAMEATPDLSGIGQLELTDQYGAADSVEAHRGNVVVAMVVTAKRLRNIRPWERSLRERYDSIDILRIADVPPESPASHDRVAEKLLERVPEGVSVLIDLDRQWATTLGLDTARPNILLIDRDGKLVASYRGRHSPELVAAVLADLEKIAGDS